MARAARRRNWKTVGIALIIAAFCVFSYRSYISRRIVSGIEMVNVVKGTIAIRALTGYCNEADRNFFLPLEQTDPSRHVIAVSAPCQDLTAFKTGRAVRLQKYIVWSVGPTDNGIPRRLPTGATRSNFAKDVAEVGQKFDLAEVDSEVTKNGSKIGIISYGLIGREVDAVYVAAVLSGGHGGTVRIVASVTGMAEIHHLALSITAYDEFRSSASLSELFASVKSLMHAALSDNLET
jgi:hypothetical protein